MSDAVIVCEGVGKAYPIYGRPSDRLLEMVWGGQERHRKFWALRDASLEVKQGETVGIIGGNGSGKSTLLKLICGTLRPTTGRVLTAGRVVGLLELGAGFNPEFTGLENIRLAAVVLGLSTEEMEARLPAIEAFADLGDFIGQPVKHYSSGMYARLAFAVAAHVDADVLVVDEILSVGDAAFSQRCMRWLRQFRERGTLLFASHDLTTVMNLCDRAIWIKQAAIQATGPARDVCGAYRLEALQRLKGQTITSRTGRDLEATGPRLPTRLESAADLAPGRDIERFRLVDANGRPGAMFEGGEHVTVEIGLSPSATSVRTVGVLVEDMKARHLFAHEAAAPPADADSKVVVVRWTMPYLAAGEYTVRAFAGGGRDSANRVAWHGEQIRFDMVPRFVSHGHIPIPVSTRVARLKSLQASPS